MFFGGRIGMFLIGVAIGGATVYTLRSQNGRKALAKVIGKGLQLKEDAATLVESIKEDASDIVEEAKHANKAKKA